MSESEFSRYPMLDFCPGLHFLIMDTSSDYDIGCRPGYFVRSFENQSYVIPNVLEGQERLPLASVLQPDLREAMEMPPGVSGTFPDVIFTLTYSLRSSKPALPISAHPDFRSFRFPVFFFHSRLLEEFLFNRVTWEGNCGRQCTYTSGSGEHSFVEVRPYI